VLRGVEVFIPFGQREHFLKIYQKSFAGQKDPEDNHRVNRIDSLLVSDAVIMN